MVEEQDFNEKGGALVEEAKRLMRDDEDDAPREADNAGPKIKMNKIGGKKAAPKAGAPATKAAPTTAAAKAEPQQWSKAADKNLSVAGFSEQDIEFMKKAIQVLCQSTNPLGKSIDFVSDDIDSMNKEYDYWRKEANNCLTSLTEQQKITEDVIQPLQDQLADLEERIKEQSSKVNSIKSTIIRNDLTIQNLLMSVIAHG